MERYWYLASSIVSDTPTTNAYFYKNPLLTSSRLELSVMPTIKPKKIRAPGTKKYASARKSNLLEKERPRPLSSQIPVGGESSSLRPPSLSPEDSSSEEYTSSEDESEYSDEEEELGDMRTLAEVSNVLLLSIVYCRRGYARPSPKFL